MLGRLCVLGRLCGWVAGFSELLVPVSELSAPASELPAASLFAGLLACSLACLPALLKALVPTIVGMGGGRWGDGQWLGMGGCRWGDGQWVGNLRNTGFLAGRWEWVGWEVGVGRVRSGRWEWAGGEV